MSRLEALLRGLRADVARGFERLAEAVERIGRQPGAYTRREAAAELRVGMTKMRELLKNGTIQPCEGSDRIIPRSEVEKYQAARQLPTFRGRGGRTSTPKQTRAAGSAKERYTAALRAEKARR